MLCLNFKISRNGLFLDQVDSSPGRDGTYQRSQETWVTVKTTQAPPRTLRNLQTSAEYVVGSHTDYMKMGNPYGYFVYLCCLTVLCA